MVVRRPPACPVGTAEIVLNRPHKLNAMNLAWVRDLDRAVTELSGDPELRVLVIRGAGRAFCAGLDQDMLAEQGMPDDFFGLQEKAFTALERLPAIVIARIHGHCIGGGLQLALACDIRIATGNAVLGLTAATSGLVPGMASWRLPRFVGVGRALRLSLSSERVTASGALGMGLVDHVVPDEEADDIVARYAAVPAEAARGIKELTRTAFDTDFGAAYQRGRELIADCLDGPGVAAANRAWAARRTARG